MLYLPACRGLFSEQRCRQQPEPPLLANVPSMLVPEGLLPYRPSQNNAWEEAARVIAEEDPRAKPVSHGYMGLRRMDRVCRRSAMATLDVRSAPSGGRQSLFRNLIKTRER
jgi:hypothetical protein